MIQKTKEIRKQKVKMMPKEPRVSPKAKEKRVKENPASISMIQKAVDLVNSANLITDC